jgi:hypothetical protein
VSFVISLTLDGKDANVVNIWHKYDVEAGNDLVLRLKPVPLPPRSIPPVAPKPDGANQLPPDVSINRPTAPTALVTATGTRLVARVVRCSTRSGVELVPRTGRKKGLATVAQPVASTAAAMTARTRKGFT